jgi:hypothetical protein
VLLIRIGTRCIDTTPQCIKRAETRLAELRDFLTETGKAEVIKPDEL